MVASPAGSPRINRIASPRGHVGDELWHQPATGELSGFGGISFSGAMTLTPNGGLESGNSSRSHSIGASVGCSATFDEKEICDNLARTGMHSISTMPRWAEVHEFASSLNRGTKAEQDVLPSVAACGASPHWSFEAVPPPVIDTGAGCSGYDGRDERDCVHQQQCQRRLSIVEQALGPTNSSRAARTPPTDDESTCHQTHVSSCSALDFGVEQTWENMMKQSGWADPTEPEAPIDERYLGILPFGDSRPPAKPKRKRKSRAKVKRPEGDGEAGAGGAAGVGGAVWPSVLERVGGNAAGEIPRLEQGEQTTPTDRSRSSKSQSNHRHKSPKPAGGVTLPLLGGVARPVEKGDKKPKRRCRKRDPNEVPSQPWSEEEIEQFRSLVEREGATAWKEKAIKLAALSGNHRTPKALHTRWLREIGRIVDKPRGADQVTGGQGAWLEGVSGGALLV